MVAFTIITTLVIALILILNRKSNAILNSQNNTNIKKINPEEIYQFDSPKEIEANKDLDIHFALNDKISEYYKNRHIDDNLEKAIKACEDQIEFAPRAAKAFKTLWKGEPLPGHKGFEQLVIIREKQGEIEEAIRLCDIATKQGWPSDWKERKQRLLKKLNKK